MTLHVGLGTFRPVKAEEVTEHHMHSELCMMNAETANMLNETKRNGGRVICVGTTSCRTLESLVNDDGTFEAKSKWTDIFIYPGYTFKAMDGLPVIVRLLDPPLHEFLESPRELAVEIAKMEATGAAPDAIAEKRDLLEKIDGFAQQNPMLGMRGCRLGIVYPILPEMQVRAIATACARLQK